MRGQVAFETLFLVLIVLSSSILIGSLYLQTHNDTLAISAARTEILNQIGAKNENIVIESITIEKTLTETILHIKLTPPTTIDSSSIKERITKVTGYTNVTLVYE